MADPTLYLFDGYNILHACEIDDRGELVHRLASYVARCGARGVVVFDGAGDDAVYGPLEVRFAPSADRVLERLAVESRATETVCIVSSDRSVVGTVGQEVQRRSAQTFLRELAVATDRRRETQAQPSRVEDTLDEKTRERLERWRRRRY